jgi:hypothetical protein
MFQGFQDLGMEAAYLLCLVAGLAYAVIASVLHMLGVGGHDAGDVSGGHDVGGGEVSTDSSVHFSPLSPVTIAMFVTSFGAGGIISMHVFEITGIGSLGIATLTGFVIASITFVIFYKMFKMTQGSSIPSATEFAGLDAEVITGIPADGLGEIAYVVRGSRLTGPARSDDGKPHTPHSTVKIARVTGNTYYVKGT